MGRRKYRKPYSQVQTEANEFEQRWNSSTESFYLFNAHTGETISDPSGYINRRYSLWAPTEIPSKYCAITTLFPEFYASRRWGRRKFEKPLPEEKAEILLTSIARGFLARLKLRKYFKLRFSRILDVSSGYYYFNDNLNPNAEPSWYKPLLAFPEDIAIREIRVEDGADFMGAEKYTYQEFTNGPYFRRPTLGAAGKKVRAENTHFLFVDPRIDVAVRRPEEIDLREHPLGTAVWMMDGLQVKDVYLSDYAVIRTARHNHSAMGILESMKAYPDRFLMQLYGMYSLASIDVILDNSGSLTYHWRNAMDLIFDVINDKEKNIPLTLKAFAAKALHNILCLPAGRGHFWDTTTDSAADPYMEGRAGKKIVFRLKSLSRLVEHLPFDTMQYRVKEGKHYSVVETRSPTERAVDIAEFILLCFGDLACKQDTREFLTEHCCETVIIVLENFIEESLVVLAAFKALYNFSYRCEVGQKTVRQYDILNLLSQARANFPGDVDVQRQCRRLELALGDDGWRGNVEAKMDRELGMDHNRTTNASVTSTSLDELDSMSLVTLDKNITTHYNHNASVSSEESPEPRQRTESKVSFAGDAPSVHMEMSALSDNTFSMSHK